MRVDLFGQVGGDEDRNSPTPGGPPFTGPSDIHSSASASANGLPKHRCRLKIEVEELVGREHRRMEFHREPFLGRFSTDNDVWEALCNGSDPTAALSYDAAISALTTSGIPVG
jgi:hypothetical protein